MIKRIINNNKIILKNTMFLSMIEVVRMIMPFIALPYILKTVGSEKYGTIIFVQSIITYFTVLITFGLNISAVRRVSKNRDNPAELNRIVSSVFLIKTTLFVISSSILALLVVSVPEFRINYLLFIFAFIGCLSEILFPDWFFLGIEKMGNITLVRFSSILLYVILIFAFIKQDEDYIYIPLLHSLAWVFPALIGVGILWKNKVRPVLPSSSYVRSTFTESIPFFFSRATVAINHNMAKTVTGFLLGMNEVAVYDIAQKIITASIIPLQMLNQAIFPHSANKQDKAFARKVLKVMIGLAFALILFILVASPTAIRLLGIESVRECYLVCCILCLWLLATSVSVYLGTPVLVAFNYPKPYNNSVLYSTIVLVVLYSLSYLSGVYNIYIFAGVLVATESFTAIYRYIACKRRHII